ncbi:alkaline phosphatase family protein [Halococcus sp. IIIV-5B]|uniref:alkaline phosphatase family protein n=1 Tax=Halococcus sp. IIIV-5B TaxID=2321230 RepID=UPI000E72552D|nr:nucleotide pyrophosphatase/phosphodiesterase family protein [Halococcus sp. IIIV-5B]RJS97466.1 alkaline phosphatase family protein [Halococcus sp. IIIV-5B]
MTDTGRAVVLDVIGLEREHVDAGLAPNIAELVPESARADLEMPFPAVTLPAQSTLATGRSPKNHGDVANGEYDRDTDSVALWERDRESRDRLWETASEAGLMTAVFCFQHLIGTSADVALTPSPIEDEENNILEMNCWTNPDGFYDELEAEYGHFPLHTYWGPGANETSSEWILNAARESVERYDPDLLWIYVPHLDYAGLAHGPSSDELADAIGLVDDLVGGFLDSLRGDDRWDETAVHVASEYGFHDVDTPIYPNRALREAGLLEVQDDGEGGEEVDLEGSNAFAMVDHQVTHVYADEGAVDDAREALSGLKGVEQVLGEDGKEEWGVAHPNAGDLVLVAEPSAWFQYYWWHEDEDAPFYARDMDIHAKPGFDPVELFFGDEGLVSLDATKVGGSHGRGDVDGFYGTGGPAADASIPDTVDARAVAPTLADRLGVDVGMDFERDPL